MYAKTLTNNDFIYSETLSIWVATVLATTHQLGTGVTVCKMLVRDDDGNWDNTVQTFRVDSNGDVNILVDEPGIYRISILDTKTRDV